jgi:hypothetical protein
MTSSVRCCNNLDDVGIDDYLSAMVKSQDWKAKHPLNITSGNRCDFFIKDVSAYGKNISDGYSLRLLTSEFDGYPCMHSFGELLTDEELANKDDIHVAKS